MTLRKTIWIALIVLILDQVSKIYIKTHFVYQQEIEVFSWFKLFFIENRGAAWGTQLSDFYRLVSVPQNSVLLYSGYLLLL